MKKRTWMTGALAAVIAAGGIYGISAVQADGSGASSASGRASVSSPSPSSGSSASEVSASVQSTGTATTGKKLIGMEQAEKKAKAEVKGVVDSIELKRWKGSQIYEVEIDQEKREMEVRVDAYSGKVLSVREDDDNDDWDDRVPANVIGAGKAATIAEKHVQGAVAVESDLDKDDGRWVYEVELRTSRGSAEVEVHAITGKVIDTDFDDDDDDDDWDDRDDRDDRDDDRDDDGDDD
ncbi:PepSY domain-containing protein [Paenibacillus campinasensis]|uniref:PepSY domain-containing protein n=1 Tax=Paenibacillus campinasensis TaxID=66347 RepID=A0A268EW24_9BACL|nr:PepSY domain-containing protein [Paenibacillus campinasensis]PAD77284.1 hypothetical protein CHH67_09750 [Paenibacillus campinasensis]